MSGERCRAQGSRHRAQGKKENRRWEKRGREEEMRSEGRHKISHAIDIKNRAKNLRKAGIFDFILFLEPETLNSETNSWLEAKVLVQTLDCF